MTPSLRRNAVLAGTAVLLAGALVSSVAGPAHASTGGPEACWFSIDTAVTQCFVDDATLREAVLEQTGTELAPLPGSSGIDSRERGVASAAASAGTLATYIVVTFYESASYAGVRTYVTTSNSTLCTSYSYTGNSMPTGWNDRVSSFQSFGTCKTRLARDINQGGTLFGPVASAATLGSMDDEASSYFVTG